MRLWVSEGTYLHAVRAICVWLLGWRAARGRCLQAKGARGVLTAPDTGIESCPGRFLALVLVSRVCVGTCMQLLARHDGLGSSSSLFSCTVPRGGARRSCHRILAFLNECEFRGEMSVVRRVGSSLHIILCGAILRPRCAHYFAAMIIMDECSKRRRIPRQKAPLLVPVISCISRPFRQLGIDDVLKVNRTS